MGALPAPRDVAFPQKVAKWILAVFAVGAGLTLAGLSVLFVVEGFREACFSNSMARSDWIANHFRIAVVVLVASLVGLLILWIVPLTQRRK